MSVCVCVCARARACVRACVHACACVCVCLLAVDTVNIPMVPFSDLCCCVSYRVSLHLILYDVTHS